MSKLKKILLLPIIMFFSLSLFSQRFNGGFVIGGCASTLSGSLVDSLSNQVGTKFFSKPGFNVGIFTNIYFTDRAALDMEISYIQKGSRKIPGPNDTVAGTVYQSKIAMHYITLPIHFRYDFTKRFAAFTGPNIGVLVSYKYTQNYIDFTSDIEPFNTFDWSWDFGVNFRILYSLSLDVKYSTTFFLTPVRSYNNTESWKFGPFAKQFWQRGQCNQLIDFTLRWTIFGNKDIGN